MKTKQLSQKLGLNKTTVANLESKAMDEIRGGTEDWTYGMRSCRTDCFIPYSLCVCNTQPPIC